MSKKLTATSIQLPSSVEELIRLIENDEIVSINGRSNMDKKELFEMILQMKTDEASDELNQEISVFNQKLLDKISCS